VINEFSIVIVSDNHKYIRFRNLVIEYDNKMTEKVLLKKLATRIKQLRVDKGLTQQEFAALMDYEKSNMSRMESGNVNLRVTTLYKVAKVLGISVQELLDFK